jgi:tetratricopeptide (TPR) repeat protein
MTTTNNLGSFLTNQFGDRYLYNVNRNAFDMIGSDAYYRSLLGAKVFNEYQLNIIIGTDSGIFPRFIAKNGVPAGGRYIFVELPMVLEALRHDAVLEDLPPEISVITPDELMSQAEKFQLSEYVFLDAIRVQESVASSDAHLPEYRELSWSVNQQVKTEIQRTWGTTYSSVFTLRQLENLTENRIPFVETLKGQFAGRTAIILAGGPSLKAALPWIKENRERLLVIAVSRITRLLQEEGLVPHLIVSVDPQNVSFEVSREMLLYAGAPEIPLFVCSNHASPLLVSQYPGKTVYYGVMLPWRSPLDKDNLVYNGPTVSNISLSLAMHMGCKTIVLAGVDLCYSAGGGTHAAGSNENKVGPDLGQISPQIETYGGRLADTNIGYAESLEMLVQQARLGVGHFGCSLYNCSLDAAKVPDIEYRSLEDLELPEWEETAGQIINRQVPEPTAAARKTHYRRITKEINRAQAKFQLILNLSNEALKCTDGLFGRNGMERDFRHKIRMDKIERRLDNSLKDFSILVKRFGLKKFLTILRTPKKAEEWTDDQIETATREYYEAYRFGTEYLMALMESTLQRIDARLEEEQEAPDLEKLFGQWERDQQFGRLALWRQRAPESARNMSPAEQEVAERLDGKLRRLLTQETSQIAIVKANRDVKHTRSKALLLFRRKSLPELEVMAKGLAAHPDQEKALPYLHFVEGLLAELRNEPEVASACYDRLLSTPPHPLTEDALLQIANLSIAANDAPNALLAIECLTGLSPTYLPPYGEILKLVGRFADAFNAYNRYLGLVPDDVAAMLRLGMLCREAKLNDAALELFNRALVKDPMNGAAQTMIAELGAEPPQLSV